MHMRRAALALIIILTLSGLLAGVGVWVNTRDRHGSVPQRPATITTTVQEDGPGWDCRTMGNHICGSDR